MLQRKAAERGVPLAEFLRLHLDVIAFGVDTVQRLHAERIAAVVGMGGEKR